MKMTKKWLLVYLVLLMIVIGGVYLFIPAVLVVSESRWVRCNTNAAFRSVTSDAAWSVWWPKAACQGCKYQIGSVLYPQTAVKLGVAGIGFPTVLTTLGAANPDSTQLLWRCRVAAGWDPFSRIRHYRQAVALGDAMRAALAAAGPFLEQQENLYGMKIQKVMSLDSTLIVTKFETAVYPTVDVIYGHITKLRRYIADEKAKEIDHPMLHVDVAPPVTGKGKQFHVMIGIPVDRELKGTNDFSPVRFVPWKVLVGEVHGGTGTVEGAVRQLQLYISDHQLTQMAIPFQSLVTERDQESDTSRWVTQIVVPVP